jgi:hypothetical protein
MHERVRSWAEAVASRLRCLGLHMVAGAVHDGTSAAPPRTGTTARVALVRSERAAGDPRPTIALSIDGERVEVALELSPADLRSLRARMVDTAWAAKLGLALEALPEQFALGLTADDERSPASKASSAIAALVDRGLLQHRPLWLGWSVSRDVAVAHADILDEQLENAVVALGSVFTMLASHAAWHAKPDGERPAGGRDKRERRETRRRAAARDQEHESGGEAETQSETRAHGPPNPLPARPTSPHTSARPGARGSRGRPVRPARADEPGRIERGSRVRVLEGPFSGKVGVVQELDSKGGARVMLGLLAVRVDVRDLARCNDGHNRPILSTSHRKLGQPRS